MKMIGDSMSSGILSLFKEEVYICLPAFADGGRELADL